MAAARPPADQAALLRAVVAHPDEDTPRLAYADWLEEHGDAEQAAFVRDSVELSGMKPRARGRKTLAGRLRETAGANAPEWLAGIGIENATATYDRGFPLRVRFSDADDFLAAADALFEFVPLRGLVIEGPSAELTDDQLLRRLARVPGLARLADLRLWEVQEARPSAWRALLRSPHLSNLTYLSLAGCGIYDAEAEVLASAPTMTRLTDLDLGYNSVGVAGARAILESPHLKGLKNLWLEHNFFGDEEGEDEVLDALERRLGDGLHVHDSPEDEDED